MLKKGKAYQFIVPYLFLTVKKKLTYNKNNAPVFSGSIVSYSTGVNGSRKFFSISFAERGLP